MSQSSPRKPQVGGWRVVEEWAHPTKKLLMIRARGEVAETGEEEPGGKEVKRKGRWGRDAPEGTIF